MSSSSSSLQNFGRFWRTHQAAFIEQICDAIISNGGTAYAAVPRESVRGSCARTTEAYFEAIDTHSTAALTAAGRDAGFQRASARLPIDEVMDGVDIFRDHLWRLMEAYSADNALAVADIKQIEAWLHTLRRAVASGYGEVLRLAEMNLADREQTLQIQAQLIQELSTPIIPVMGGVLLVPLIGSIDEQRADSITDAVLQQIERKRADVLVIDISSISVMDTAIANHLLQMAQAVRLLGAQVVIVGIGPEVAQTVVQLGINLEGIVTLADVQSALQDVFQRKGYRIARLEDPAGA